MKRWIVQLGILVSCAVLVVACDSRDADKSMVAAKAHLSQRDWAAGIIELKNALAERPDWAEARYLLGKAFLDSGDPVAAAIEFRRASDLRHPPDAAVPLLARALLESGDPRRVVELGNAVRLDDGEARASLMTTVAQAQMALGQARLAQEALREALAAQSQFAPALLFQAREAAARGDLLAARLVVDGVLEREPNQPDALTLAGDLLLFGGNDAEAAIAKYRKAIAAEPSQVDAHVALINQLMARRDVDGVRTQLEALKKVRPRHPRTLYLEARWASVQGDLTRAAELAQELLKAMPDNVAMLQLSGVVALQQGEILRAEQHLSRVLQLMPEDKGSRLLLAQSLLQAGDHAKVLRTLGALIGDASPDPDALALAGSAHLLAGDARQAEALLGRAVKARPDDAARRAALLQARLARGDARALQDLEGLAGTDSGTAADLALISAHLRQGRLDAALKAIAQLEKKQPRSPQPALLRAQIWEGKGDAAKARESYSQALAVNAKYLPAVQGLAALDVKEGKIEQARSRFEALLRAEPENTQAIVALARLSERAGRPAAEIAEAINRAILLRPNDAALRVELVDFQLRRRDGRAALAVAQAAASALPDELVVLAALARAQEAAGESDQSRSTYAKLASLEPESLQRQLELARAHVNSGDYGRAMEAVKKALVIAPDDGAANELAVNLHVWTGRYSEAAALASELQRRLPRRVLGYGLMGDVEMARARWDAAAAAYEAALKLTPASLTAQRLHEALVRGGKSAQAEAWAARWRKQHPTDSGFVFHLGSLALAAKDMSGAEAHFRDVVRLQPEDAMALNNLAWVLLAQRKPEALSHAERANRLRPDTPAFMDTLALALANQNRTKDALAIQTRAVELAPGVPGLRLTLARLHLDAGDKDAARPHLERLKALGPSFADHSAVEELMRRL